MEWLRSTALILTGVSVIWPLFLWLLAVPALVRTVFSSDSVSSAWGETWLPLLAGMLNAMIFLALWFAARRPSRGSGWTVVGLGFLYAALAAWVFSGHPGGSGAGREAAAGTSNMVVHLPLVVFDVFVGNISLAATALFVGALITGGLLTVAAARNMDGQGTAR